MIHMRGMTWDHRRAVDPLIAAEDPAIDARSGSAFSAVRPSIEQAWIRPRYDGYLRVQAKGGDLFDRPDALYRTAGRTPS